METSITFSYYYLNQNMTFEELKKSTTLIRDAMLDTIKSLRLKAIDSSETTLMGVLEQPTTASEASGSEQSTEHAGTEDEPST